MGRMSSRRLISQEPLVNLVHRHLELLLSVLTLVFILYLTCLPTESYISPSTDSSEASPVSKRDLIQNILLYVPLGFWMTLAGRKAKLAWYENIFFVITVGILISCLCEGIQRFLPGRVSSRMDVLANGAGVVLGGILAIMLNASYRVYRTRIREGLRTQPVMSTFVAGAVVYAVLSLVPFQLELTPKIDKTVLNPARWTAWTPDQAMENLTESTPDARTRNDQWIDWIVVGFSGLLLGGLGSYSLLHEYEFGRSATLVLILWMSLLIGGVLEGFQMFDAGHGFHLVRVTLLMAGATIGAMLGWLCKSSPLEMPSRYSAWFHLGSLGGLVLIVARDLNPFVLDFSQTIIQQRWHEVSWWPFLKCFDSGDDLASASNLLAHFGRYAVWGVWLSLALQTAGLTGLKSRIRVVGGTSLLVSTVIEVLQLGCSSRSVDVTHILVAVSGCLVGLISIQWWFDFLKSSRRNHVTSTHKIPQSGAMPVNV